MELSALVKINSNKIREIHYFQKNEDSLCFQLFVLTTATPVCFASQSAKRTDKDVTMERGAIGCEVAEATILRIETAKIFLE